MAEVLAAGAAVGCSALGLVEVLCTLSRKARSRDLPAAVAKVKGLEAERDFGLFHKVFMTPKLLKHACECARRHGLRGADTVHLASCLELKRSEWGAALDVVMVSCDVELLTGAVAAGVNVRNPEEERVLLPAR